MPGLQEAIDRLGTELVACSDCCAGIWCDQSKGILPRTLFLERPEAVGRGSLAIGLNPGTSKLRERSFYLEAGTTYSNVKTYRASIGGIAYFERTRKIIDQLGLRGPIIWSNLAKCENASGQKEIPPLQTMRHCAGRCLARELAIAPADWPIVALGRDALVALGYLAPARTVIGIPHPKSRAFPKILENGELRKELVSCASAALTAVQPTVVWLTTEKSAAEQGAAANRPRD